MTLPLWFDPEHIFVNGIWRAPDAGHLLPVDLPFGGVGKSGHGREKGGKGRDRFSTLEAVANHHG